MAVVAHAVLGMARSLAPDRARAAIAVGGMVLAMLLPSALGQVLVILAAGLIGLVWLRPDQTTAAGEGLAVASFAWWRGFCSAPWRSCCRDHAGLAAGRCRGLNREGCARSGPFGSLPLRQSPKAPPLTRITMPRPMRTMGKRMCSQRSSTSAIGGRVATNFARATRTATSARKTMQ